MGKCYRCSTVVEPYLSDQWFVKMKPLADKALNAWKKGEIVFYPQKWENTYRHWMENIRDWCISRQLWWGHRIPVWYCLDCGEMIVITSYSIHYTKLYEKETEKMISAVKKGDKIVTIGGIHGEVTSTKEKSVIVKVDENCKIEFSRSAIASVVVDEKAEKPAKSAKASKKDAAKTETSAEEAK